MKRSIPLILIFILLFATRGIARTGQVIIYTGDNSATTFIEHGWMCMEANAYRAGVYDNTDGDFDDPSTYRDAIDNNKLEYPFYSEGALYVDVNTRTIIESNGLYQGMAYKWGGFTAIDQFDMQLGNGLLAGKERNEPNYTREQTTGIDCSGFVGRINAFPWKPGTWHLEDIGETIEVLPEIGWVRSRKKGEFIAL